MLKEIKSSIASTISTVLLKILFTVITYNLLKDMYVVNTYGTLVITYLCLRFIDTLNITLKFK